MLETDINGSEQTLSWGHVSSKQRCPLHITTPEIVILATTTATNQPWKILLSLLRRFLNLTASAMTKQGSATAHR